MSILLKDKKKWNLPYDKVTLLLDTGLPSAPTSCTFFRPISAFLDKNKNTNKETIVKFYLLLFHYCTARAINVSGYFYS